MKTKKFNPKPDSVAEARMMAPGITVVYQIETSDKKELPWGLGVCEHVDKEKKMFRLQLFSPSSSDVHLAPWSIWEPITKTKEFSFTKKSWLKVNKLLIVKKGSPARRIHTRVLHKIRRDKRFNWQWISVLDPTDLPEACELEFDPDLGVEVDSD